VTTASALTTAGENCLPAGGDARAERRVSLDLVVLGGREPDRLEQNVVGDPDFSDVMQQPAVVQQSRPLGRLSQLQGELLGESGNAF
jgi:hypothetical protein